MTDLKQNLIPTLDVRYSLHDINTRQKDLSDHDHDSVESSPLDSTDDIIQSHLGKTTSQSFFARYFGAKSMKGAVFNLIVAVVGAGILSFPFAFRAAGLLWGLFLLLMCTYFSYLSLNLLIIASDYMPPHIVRPSYLTLSLQCGGRKLAVFTQSNVILSLLGSAISRMVGAGGIIVILYMALFNGDKTEGHKFYIYFIVGFSSLIIFPLSLMRSMSSLRFTSLLSVTCSLLLTVCLLIEYFILCDSLDVQHNESYKDYKTCFWKTSEFKNVFTQNHYSRMASFTLNGFLTAIPIFIFGYNCQPNLFPIYDSLQNASKMQRVIKYALSISVSLYIISGSFAFLTFLNGTCGNILLNDFHTSPEMVAAAILFTVSMVLATPVFINAIRENINDMIWRKKQIPLIPHILVTFAICAVCVTISVLVSDIATVFGLIGCTTNPITGYILPTFFVWKLVPKHDQQHRTIKILSLVMVLIVAVISLLSLGFKIYTFATGNGTEHCENVQSLE
eukprot:CAMPEP_0202693038 /NCGR_PEP_ID=MMETSP1385-20130828/7258_1 /ASSEMBLY_ACC=CAM_ASM_000861 /TAXON_ID=933848 /ORGANISM="Elphidium margaritaceum" /LENGTH=504 /DNA_ID=CAMNT_0049348665 /DNA_START=22 /DNA_END=1536 /DNA_ORIENTATION=+